jgi:hypothetical protein
MKKVNIDRISNEEWHAIEIEMMIEAYQVAIMALVDQGGSESAIDHLRPYMRMSGHAYSINMIKLFDIQGNDLEIIGDVSHIYEKFYAHGRVL